MFVENEPNRTNTHQNSYTHSYSIPISTFVVVQVKVLKKPRFDLSKLLELHGDGGGKATEGVVNTEGVVVERAEGYEPPVQEAV